MSYHVFIERAQDAGSVADVAAVIAQRYGMPVDAIKQRMTAGRFRVKANIDLQSAKAFAADLQKLGAVASVVDASTGQSVQARATAQTVARPRATAQTVARPPGIPTAGQRARAPVAGVQRPPMPAPAAAPTPVPPPQDPEDMASGLAAAYSGSHEVQNLGALESDEYNLSSLDGDPGAAPAATPEATPAATASFAPPADGEEAIVLLDTDTPQKSAAPAEPADEFAPPSDESVVAVADIALEAPKKTPKKTPQPMQAQKLPPGQSEFQKFSQKIAVQRADSEPAAAEKTGGTPKQSQNLREQFREQFVERPRLRFGAGIVLAIMLAWIPAQIFWGAKVASAQAELNVSLQETLTLAKTDDAVWSDFGDIVRKERELAGSRLFNKRITAVMIWLGLGVLLGYGYYRKIPWDDI